MISQFEAYERVVAPFESLCLEDQLAGMMSTASKDARTNDIVPIFSEKMETELKQAVTEQSYKDSSAKLDKGKTASSLNVQSVQKSLRRSKTIDVRTKKVTINRLYAAYKRASNAAVSHKKAKTEAWIVHLQLNELAETLHIELNKRAVPAFDKNPEEAAFASFTENKSYEPSTADVQAKEDISFGGMVQTVEKAKSEVVPLGNSSPRTPASNQQTRETLRKRLEEAPYKKDEIFAPDYLYNSDDELFA